MSPAQAALDLDTPPPCHQCGGHVTWTPECEPEDVTDDDPMTYAGLCSACGWSWPATPTIPTYRTAPGCAEIVAEVGRLRAEVDGLRAANERLAARAGGGAS